MIDRFVKTVISRTNSTLPSDGFGEVLFLAQLTAAEQAERVKRYTGLEEVNASTLSENVKRGLRTFMSQQNGLNSILVGKRTEAADDSATVTVTAAAPGQYSIRPGTADGVGLGVNVLYTATASDTTETIANALAQGIADLDQGFEVSAVADLGAGGHQFVVTPLTSHPTVDAFFLDETPDNAAVTVVNNTVAGVGLPEADLNAIQAEGFTFFGLALESRFELDAVSASAWANGKNVLYVAQSRNPNLLGDITALSHANTALIIHDNNRDFVDLAWLSERLALRLNQEQGTWAFRQLSGVAATDVSRSTINSLDGQNVNTYTRCGTRSLTFQGILTNGLYIDQLTTELWAMQRAEQAIFDVLAGNRLGVPYTVQGVAQIEAALRGIANLGERIGHFAPGSTEVIVPNPDELSAAQRQSRCLPEVSLRYREAGFIHCVELTIQISS